MKLTSMKAKKDWLQIRISTFDKNRLKILADKYSGGDMTAWVIHAIWNAPRKFIKKKEKRPTQS